MWEVGDHLFQGVLIVGVAASLAFYVAGSYSAWDFFRRQHRGRRAVPHAAPWPAVSILKPLKGLDADLYQTLATYCRIDYPTYQIVFGVRSADDPAIGVVRQLRSAYPHAPIDLVIDSRVYGTNYKVSNLHNMYAAAAHDIIVIADSDIRVPIDYLRRIVPQLDDPQVGVVSCLYRAMPQGGLATVFEALSINTDFALMVLVARVVETPTYAFGATMALRRTTLDELGGFLPLANLLADDYSIGQRAVGHGYRSALCDLVVETVLGPQSWRRLLEHQLRWARTYRNCRPGGYFLSIVTHGMLWATLNLLHNQFSPLACVVAAGVCAARMGTATTLAKRYLGATLSWREALLIPLKDLFMSIVWVLSYLGNTVSWRGSRFRVLRNGQMVWASAAAALDTPASSCTAPAPQRRRAA